ncbi:MAG TPA: peptidase S41, partial [Azospirillaceae bacterium]|nr:peptidase S41 [Azospirillaceae bacterium]
GAANGSVASTPAPAKGAAAPAPAAAPGDEDDAAKTATTSDDKAVDYQLTRAMDLLRGVSMFHARAN